MPQDYINRFRKFRDRLREELGERDGQVILQHWLAYLEHFLCMCEDCDDDDTHTIHAPDVSYEPTWPDRFDGEDSESQADEWDNEGGFTP